MPSDTKPPAPGFAAGSPPSDATRWLGHMADDIGATYGPEPLAFLDATAGGLHLCGNRGSYRVARDAVVKIGRGNLYPWCFSSVRIHHRLPQFPRELQFKPLDARPREVLDRLRALGYPVR